MICPFSMTHTIQQILSHTFEVHTKVHKNAYIMHTSRVLELQCYARNIIKGFCGTLTKIKISFLCMAILAILLIFGSFWLFFGSKRSRQLKILSDNVK